MKIGIIGLGYVGLFFVFYFVEVGIEVYGFDIDLIKVDIINGGCSLICYILNECIVVVNVKFMVSNDFVGLSVVDGIIICVLIFLIYQCELDMIFIFLMFDFIGLYLCKGQMMFFESIIYFGMMDEIICGFVKNLGFIVGEDFYVVYLLECEDLGNVKFNVVIILKVIGGMMLVCFVKGKEVYLIIVQCFVEVFFMCVVEMIKFFENIYCLVNISFVNEMKIVVNKMGVDIFEVIDVVVIKLFGFIFYFLGLGFGGYCILIDLFYFVWKVCEYGLNICFIELLGEIDNDIWNWVFGCIMDGLNGQKKVFNGSWVYFFGIVYKKNIDDVCELFLIWFMEVVKVKGGVIFYFDFYLLIFLKM